MLRAQTSRLAERIMIGASLPRQDRNATRGGASPRPCRPFLLLPFRAGADGRTRAQPRRFQPKSVRIRFDSRLARRSKRRNDRTIRAPLAHMKGHSLPRAEISPAWGSLHGDVNV